MCEWFNEPRKTTELRFLWYGAHQIALQRQEERKKNQATNKNIANTPSLFFFLFCLSCLFASFSISHIRIRVKCQNFIHSLCSTVRLWVDCVWVSVYVSVRVRVCVLYFRMTLTFHVIYSAVLYKLFRLKLFSHHWIMESKPNTAIAECDNDGRMCMCIDVLTMRYVYATRLDHHPSEQSEQWIPIRVIACVRKEKKENLSANCAICLLQTTYIHIRTSILVHFFMF